MVDLIVHVIRWLQTLEDMIYVKNTLIINWEIMWDMDQEYLFQTMLARVGLPTKPYEINIDKQCV
jgi:hypothetical protein